MHQSRGRKSPLTNSSSKLRTSPRSRRSSATRTACPRQPGVASSRPPPAPSTTPAPSESKNHPLMRLFSRGKSAAVTPETRSSRGSSAARRQVAQSTQEDPQNRASETPYFAGANRVDSCASHGLIIAPMTISTICQSGTDGGVKWLLRIRQNHRESNRLLDDGTNRVKYVLRQGGK